MILEKNGQVISLENENHIDAFLANGWAEVKASAPSPAPKAEAPAEEPKAEAKAEKKTEVKKPATRKKQEK